MSSSSDWEMPNTVQPKPENFAYDLEGALASLVGLRAIIPADAFTAETLGTERAGNGVLIRGDGLVLTIGYLITEAETVWISHSGGGPAVAGHVLGYDQETGFGLVQALARLDLPSLSLGSSKDAEIGEQVVVGGGRRLADQGPQAPRLLRFALEGNVLGHDARVPGTARRRNPTRDEVGEHGREVQHPKAPPAGEPVAPRCLAQIGRDRHGAGYDVKEDVPLRAQQHQHERSQFESAAQANQKEQDHREERGRRNRCG